MRLFPGDLRFSARAMLRNRGLTAVALLTLVFGLVLNTAAFSVCNALCSRRI